MTAIFSDGYRKDTRLPGDENHLEEDSSYEEITAISGWVRVCQDDDVSEITAPSVVVGKKKKRSKKKKNSPNKPTKPSSVSSSRKQKSKFPDLSEIAEDEEAHSNTFDSSSRRSNARPESSPLQELGVTNRRKSRGEDAFSLEKPSGRHQPCPRVPRRKNSKIQETNCQLIKPFNGPRSVDDKSDDAVINLRNDLKSSKQKNPPSAPKRTSSDKSSDRAGTFQKVQSVSALDLSARRSNICRKPPCRKELSFASLDKLQRQGSADLTEAITASDCSAEYFRCLHSATVPKDDLVNSLGLSPAHPLPISNSSSQATKKGVKGFFQRFFSPRGNKEKKKKVNFGDVPHIHRQQEDDPKHLSRRNPSASLSRASSQPIIHFVAEPCNGTRGPNRARPHMTPRASSVAIFSAATVHEQDEEDDSSGNQDEELWTASPPPTSRSKAMMMKSKSVPILEQTPPSARNTNVPRMVSMRVSKVPPNCDVDDNEDNDDTYDNDKDLLLMNTPTMSSKSGKLKSNDKKKPNKSKKEKKDKCSSNSRGKKKSSSSEKYDIVSPLPSIGSTKASTSTLSHSMSRSKSLNVIKVPMLDSDKASSTTMSPVRERIRKLESRSSFGTADGTRASFGDAASVCSSNKPPSIFGSNW